jgi:hypothetical protein
MADCPYCRKPIDPLATRCPHCRSEVQLTPALGAEPTFYTLVIAPALGAVLMSLIFCLLSPFSGLALHAALGGPTDLTLQDYMVGFDTLAAVALIAMALSALCGWLRHRDESLVLSVLAFATPLAVPPVLVIAFQIAGITGSV